LRLSADPASTRRRSAWVYEEVRDNKLICEAADLDINHFHALSNLALVGEAVKPVRSRVLLGKDSKEQTRTPRVAQ